MENIITEQDFSVLCRFLSFSYSTILYGGLDASEANG